MGMTGFLSRSRGVGNLFARIVTVLSRFGFSAERFHRRLNRFREITAEMQCRPTFAVTAVTLRRHPDVIQDLSRQGAEFAVHGYIHTDYQHMAADQQVRHFRMAIEEFGKHQVPYSGFRAPYLRTNGQTPAVMGEVGFAYDSSHVLGWDVLDRGRYPEQAWREYERLLDFYQARPAADHLSLPKWSGDFLEIPVSIPDDEAMVDRLGMTGPGEIAAAWRGILDRTYERGELFTVQLHPERIDLCEEGLRSVLEQAGRLDPPVWMATLGEITDWWREKSAFDLQVTADGPGRYLVAARCSDRATLLVRNCRTGAAASEWAQGYSLVEAREFALEGPSRPVIGLAADTHPAAVDFLRSEGYVAETGDSSMDCGVYLEGLSAFEESDEKGLVDRIEGSDAPMVRYWRWPERARSAVSVTGDIDAMTLVDFAMRIVENWRRNSI